MYPVQFAQSDGIIIRYNKNATIRQQYTGKGYSYRYQYNKDIQNNKDIQIKKQTQGIVRFVLDRCQKGQYRYVLSFLVCLDFAVSYIRIGIRSIAGDRNIVIL